MDDERAEGSSPPKKQTVYRPDRAKMREMILQHYEEVQARAKAARRREERERLRAQEEAEAKEEAKAKEEAEAREEAEAERNWIIQQVRVNARSLDYMAEAGSSSDISDVMFFQRCRMSLLGCPALPVSFPLRPDAALDRSHFSTKDLVERSSDHGRPGGN